MEVLESFNYVLKGHNQGHNELYMNLEQFESKLAKMWQNFNQVWESPKDSMNTGDWKVVDCLR